MPASRSRSRTPDSKTKPAPARAKPWPLVLVVVLIIGVVVAVALPASQVTRFLPPQVQAEDLTGTVWHGSAGRVRYSGRELGALEWRVHPASLLKLSLGVDLHWVKVSSVMDGTVTLRKDTFVARDLRGNGAIEDLSELGVPPGWRGNATVNVSEARGSFSKLYAVVGSLALAQVTSTGIAQGAELGSYEVTLGPQSVGTDGGIEATLRDTGGPVELLGSLKYGPDGTGTLSGTIKERPEAAQALRDQIANLAQLRPRDAQGRIPVDLEFSL